MVPRLRQRGSGRPRSSGRLAKDQCRAKADTGAAIENSRWRRGFRRCRCARRTRREETSRSCAERYRRAGRRTGGISRSRNDSTSRKPAVADAMRLDDILAQRGRAGRQSRRRKHLHRKVQPETPARRRPIASADRTGAAGRSSRRAHIGENIAVPEKQRWTSRARQHDEPAQDKRRRRRSSQAARTGWQGPRRTAGRKQRQPFKSTASIRIVSTALSIGDARAFCGRSRSKIETRHCHDVDRENAEQGNAPQHVDGVDRSVGLIGRGDAAPSEVIAI